ELATGKSCLVLKFVNDEFHKNIGPTIGVDFLSKRFQLDDAKFKFEIWDTPGLKKYRLLTLMYCRNVQAAIVVYNVMKAHSLDKAKSFVKELWRQANPNIVIAFVDNKINLVQPYEDEEDECPKKRDNVRDIFTEIAK
ncbi:5476_t:CDS:2, partial [Racocetra persica]